MSSAELEHQASLAHHFYTPGQQFEAGKLGMWLFLATEVLFFGGLFCAYAVYRANHPEIFRYAHQFLDLHLGALNTAILIASSLTMAFAVRSAQLGRNRALVLCLALTLAGAAAFLGVKGIEYEHKWKHGLLWGTRFHPTAEAEAAAAAKGAGAAGTAGEAGAETAEQGPPRNAQIFFGIYFAMTGLHGLHVIAGMGVIAWLIVRAAKGHFGVHYFAPVDNVGLYWHLVDIIWIFLFPLLYLIR